LPCWGGGQGRVFANRWKGFTLKKNAFVLTCGGQGEAQKKKPQKGRKKGRGDHPGPTKKKKKWNLIVCTRDSGARITKGVGVVWGVQKERDERRTRPGKKKPTSGGLSGDVSDINAHGGKAAKITDLTSSKKAPLTR